MSSELLDQLNHMIRTKREELRALEYTKEQLEAVATPTVIEPGPKANKEPKPNKQDRLTQIKKQAKQARQKRSAAQKRAILKQAEEQGIKQTMQEHGLSEATFYYWKKQRDAGKL